MFAMNEFIANRPQRPASWLPPWPLPVGMQEQEKSTLRDIISRWRTAFGTFLTEGAADASGSLSLRLTPRYVLQNAGSLCHFGIT